MDVWRINIIFQHLAADFFITLSNTLVFPEAEPPIIKDGQEYKTDLNVIISSDLP